LIPKTDSLRSRLLFRRQIPILIARAPLEILAIDYSRTSLNQGQVDRAIADKDLSHRATVFVLLDFTNSNLLPDGK